MSTIIIDTEVLRNANKILDNDKTYYQNKQTTFNNIYGSGGNLIKFLNSIRESYQNASDNISNVSTYIDEYISNVETLENKMSSCSSIIDVDIPDLYFNVTSYTSNGALDKTIDDVKIKRYTELFINIDGKLKEELARLGVDINYTPEKKIKEGTNDILVVKFANGVECEYKILEDETLQLLSGISYYPSGSVYYEGKTNSDGSPLTSTYYNENHGIIKQVIYLKNGSIKETNYKETYKESTIYNKDGNAIYTKIINDDNSSRVLTYESNKIATCTIFDEHGEQVAYLDKANIYTQIGDTIYYINDSGTLSIHAIDEFQPTLNDDTIKYLPYTNNGVNYLTLIHDDKTVSYITEKEAKEMGLIKGKYVFEERTSLSFDGLYYQSSYGQTSENYAMSGPSCAWYVAGRINEVYDELGMNKTWTYCGNGDEWYYAAPSEYGRSTNIKDVRAGDAVSYNNSYGKRHVIFIEKVNDDGTVNVSEANVGTGETAGFRYSENVTLDNLSTWCGQNFLGCVHTLPE